MVLCPQRGLSVFVVITVFLSFWQVLANDKDGLMNNHITYSIVEGNPLGHFMIDPKAGEIYTAKHLDREEVSNMVHFDTENKISEP